MVEMGRPAALSTLSSRHSSSIKVIKQLGRRYTIARAGYLQRPGHNARHYRGIAHLTAETMPHTIDRQEVSMLAIFVILIIGLMLLEVGDAITGHTDD
jgi:hypothetical protein